MLGGIGRLLKGGAGQSASSTRAATSRAAIRRQAAADRKAIKGARARAGANRPESLGRPNYGRPGGPRGSGMPMTYRTPDPGPMYGPASPSNRQLFAGRRKAFLNQANTQSVTMGPTRNIPPSARERGVAGRRAFLEQSQQAARVRANVAASQASRTGGFRRSGVGRPGPTASRTASAAQPGVTSGTGATAGKNVSRQGQNIPSRFRNMDPKTRRMLMVGGAAAVGVTAASNRRGQGTSSGRQSMTGY